MIKNLEIKECKQVLYHNYIGHLAYIYQHRPFVVPITYFYDEANNQIICYSGDGHKTNAMRKNNGVALQVGDLPSVTKWKSVMVHGTFEQLYGTEAKSRLHDFSLGVKDVIYKTELKDLDFISEFSSKILSEGNPIIYRINIEEIVGKKRIEENLNSQNSRPLNH